MLAGLVAGALASSPARASGNGDVYNFFAAERAKLAAATADKAAAQKPAAEKSAGGKSAAKVAKSGGKPRGSSRANVSRKRQVPLVAPGHMADVAVQEKVREPRRRIAPEARALGYHTPSRERYRDLIAKHAAANGLPFSLGDAVVRVESRYQPHVTNGGAVGLMQIKPATARGLGYRGDAKGLMHPETNIQFGMKYLGQAYRMANGDICGTVMRYQSGHYAKRMNRANLAYCAKVRTISASVDASAVGAKATVIE